MEKPFVVEIDHAEEVKVFAKLPSKFKIDTPPGGYNPDWAYVQEAEGECRVCFVTEAKGGGNNDIYTRPTEQGKIESAAKHFDPLAEPGLVYNIKMTYR